MKRFWLVAVLAIFAVSIGCGGGAEGTAKKMLAALKQGDSETFMEYVDMQGMYDMQKEQMGEAADQLPEYKEWKKQAVENAQQQKPEEGFDYDVVSAEEEGDTAQVTVKIKENKDADWEEYTVTFKRIDGKWMLSAEGLIELAPKGPEDTPEMPEIPSE